MDLPSVPKSDPRRHRIATSKASTNVSCTHTDALYGLRYD
jgi:hypothetical protein